jgi:hypothetical protein
MARRLVALTLTAALAAASPAFAWNGGGHGGGGWHGGGTWHGGGGWHGGGWHGGGWHGGWHGGRGCCWGGPFALGLGLGALGGAYAYGYPYAYPPPVYYPPPPVYYAPPPQTYSQAPVPGGGQSCYAGAYFCPMERPVASGASCYCPGNNGERIWGKAS